MMSVSAQGTIINWAESNAEWNQRLHVEGNRWGCSSAPADCLTNLEPEVTKQNLRQLFVAVVLDTSSSQGYATQYSELSLTHPLLSEVGIDDFVGQYKALFSLPGVDPAAVLQKTIANLKSKNTRLTFGVTLYETELISSPYLQDAMLPATLRAQFDTLHLYLLRRGDGPNYANYVQIAKKLFPNARVIAGSYAVDTLDWPWNTCGSSGRCTLGQQTDLYRTSIQIQADLLRQGIVQGIEFYPGNFGIEEQWGGFNEPSLCAASRKQECIDNTKALRQIALTALQEGPAPAPPPPVLPQPPPDAPVTATPKTSFVPRVHPNPWRGDRHENRMITFDQLSGSGITIKIFTTSGHLIKTLTGDGETIDWDRTDSSGRRVASGIYLYIVTNAQDEKAKGKLAIVR